MSHRFFFSVLSVALALICSRDSAGQSLNVSSQPAATVTNEVYDTISINNMLIWFGNDGSMSKKPFIPRDGLEWPKGSGKYLVYAEGVLVGGKVSDAIRMSGSTYRHGYQSGTIKPDGTASDPSDPLFRMYKARKVRRSDYERLPADLQARLRSDFAGWPVGDGAPFQDNNWNGVYEPDFEAWLDDSTKSDAPLLIGDEVLWFVMNDLDTKRTRELYGSPPIGVEVQSYSWAYNAPGCAGNAVFTKQTIINKGTANLTDAYLGIWTDTDLGYGLDDFIGVDTLRQLGYIYNGLDYDSVYSVPPAFGYVLLQGPIVPAKGETAHFNFKKRIDYRNLPLSSFSFYLNSSSTYRDPVISDPEGSMQMYNNMSGFLWNFRPYTDPTTLLDTKFPLSGLPFDKSGWIDGIIAEPGDRRFLMSTGPFNLAVGDTQEIVYVRIAAQGTDRMNSLAVLFQDAVCAHSFFRTVVTSVPHTDALPAEMSISQNYPNPFGASASGSRTTTIPISASKHTHATLRVYDILGRHVETLADGFLDAGTYQYRFTLPGSYPAGVYTAVLTAGNTRRCVRLIAR